MDQVMRLTLRQFVGMLKEIGAIVRLEYGGGGAAQPREMSAAAQHKLAMRMFGGNR